MFAEFPLTGERSLGETRQILLKAFTPHAQEMFAKFLLPGERSLGKLGKYYANK